MRLATQLLALIVLFYGRSLGSGHLFRNHVDRSSRELQDHDEWEVATFTDNILRRNDPAYSTSDETDFYYPVVAENQRDDYENAFPLVVFLQAALADKQYFSRFATHLSGLGYVVAVPNHLQQLGPFAPPDFFASQWTINDALEDAQERDVDENSPLFKIVDTENVGVSGHSFGAVAGMFAVTGTCQVPFCFGNQYVLPQAVKAAAVVSTHLVETGFGAICPCVVDPGLIALYPMNLRPVAIISGSNDDLDCTSLSYFDHVDGEKAWIRLDGVNHWGVADFQTPPRNTPDCQEQERPQEWSIAKFAKWVGVVFDAYLKQNNGAMKKLAEGKSETGVHVEYDP